MTVAAKRWPRPLAVTVLAAGACLGLVMIAPVLASPTPAAAPQPVTLHASPAPLADLYPGGSGAAQFTVDNPNPFAVRLLSMSFGAVASSSPAACPPSLLTVHPLPITDGIVVAAGARTVSHSVPGAFTLAKEAPNGCQGVIFTITARGQAVSTGDLPASQDSNRPNTNTTLAGTGLPVDLLVGGALTLTCGVLLVLLTRFRHDHQSSARADSRNSR